MSELNSESKDRIPPNQSGWWKGVFVGALMALPLGWLLSYGAALMTFLGLFFFLLFGLVIGAGIFRFGEASKPVPPWSRRTGVLLVSLIALGVSLWIEARDFPRDVSDMVLSPRYYPIRPDNLGPVEIKEISAQYAKDFLDENYPPGGALGYFMWVATSNGIEIKAEELPVQPYLKFNHTRFIWILRVSLSFIILAYAMNSIVRPLSKDLDDEDSEEEDDSEDTIHE